MTLPSVLGCQVCTALNPIPTGLGHVTLIYGLIPPMAGRNRVKKQNVPRSKVFFGAKCASAEF